MVKEITAQDVIYVRKKLDKTQQEFGVLIGASRETVHNYESGRKIPENKQRLIEELLVKVDTDDISKAPGLKTTPTKKMIGLVPYFDVDFAAGNEYAMIDSPKAVPDYYMDVPEFSGCSAFRAYSDSMESKIKSGSILFGTKVEAWREHLEYGQIYGIVCNDGRRYLKYIRKDKNNPRDFFLLRSANDMYDDFELPKDAIRSIWLIHGWLNKGT